MEEKAHGLVRMTAQQAAERRKARGEINHGDLVLLMGESAATRYSRLLGVSMELMVHTPAREDRRQCPCKRCEYSRYVEFLDAFLK